ncbi:hypothetical protein TNCV_960561 [Trichonephila clavipes]|nr:hypothetical protein TNCV_960561 [Trichonephila clavipes]
MWIEQTCSNSFWNVFHFVASASGRGLSNLISTAITVDKNLNRHGTGSQETEDRNNLADCDSERTLVILSRKFTFKLKMKISFIEFQVSPRALEHSSDGFPNWNYLLPSLRKYGKVLDELDRHFLK